MVEKLTALIVAVEAYTVDTFAVDPLSNAVMSVLVRIVDADMEEM